MTKSLHAWTPEEVSSIPQRYRCELLVNNVQTLELNNSSLPSDSFLVSYKDDEGDKVDICRGSRMVDVFDLYYDRFGATIHSIQFTRGRVNPKIWSQNKKKTEEVSKKK